jgi:hypothetical protein
MAGNSGGDFRRSDDLDMRMLSTSGRAGTTGGWIVPALSVRQTEFYKTTRFRVYRLRIGPGKLLQTLKKTCLHLKTCVPKFKPTIHENRIPRTDSTYETKQKTCHERHISD